MAVVVFLGCWLLWCVNQYSAKTETSFQFNHSRVTGPFWKISCFSKHSSHGAESNYTYIHEWHLQFGGHDFSLLEQTQEDTSSWRLY
jgi:hypothetical protein